MPVIRTLLNGASLVSVGGSGYSSLDWDVTASRFETAAAMIQFRGLKERQDGNYDCHYWLESFELRNGDEVVLEWQPSNVAAAPARIETHEQAEDFRHMLETMERSADAAPILRPRAGLRVEVSGLEVEEVCAEGELEIVYCAGFWARDRYAEQWNVRLATYPAQQQSRSGVWHPVSRSIHVTVPA